MDDYDAPRRRMMDRHLRDRGITSHKVLAAIERVPRERFVPVPLAGLAYADQALEIDCGQTISQPYIVALMSESLQLARYHRVLEIGTGSGYQTAVLAELAGEVFSVERYPELSAQAAANLHRLGYRNIRFRVADGALGWPNCSPYDRIIVTAAARACPLPLWQQLRDGGMLIAPFGSGGKQMLKAVRKVSDRPLSIVLTACRFVPLVTDEPLRWKEIP